MRQDNLTVKAQEALAAAREVAIARKHADVSPEHLLLALIAQDGGVVPRLLTKLGADPRLVSTDVDRALERAPKVSGENLDVGVSHALKDVWEAAARQATAMKDEFVSTEHFALALAEANGAAGDALRRAGARKDALLEALVSVRGTQRVTDKDPEAKYEALDR